MRALLRRGPERTKFVLCDVDRDHVDDILSFGFTREGDEFTRSYPSDAAHLDLALANFARVVEEMTLQHAGERAIPWDAALEVFLERVPRTLEWALIGGAALAVRGVDVTPGDVDVITDVEGVQSLDDVFLDSLVEPTQEIPGFGWFGRAFPGVRLEWLGNPSDASGVWSLGMVELEFVEWRGRQLRVPPLDVYLRIEESRGRLDRVNAIKRVMSPLT